MPNTAAILVGGCARRLGGRDKSQLDIGGRTILDRQIAALSDVADRLVIVTNGERRLAQPGIETVADMRPGCGSLGGIYTALRVAEAPVLVIACDMPFLTPGFLAYVRDAAAGAAAAIPRTADGFHPLCAYYTPACVGPIERRLDAGQLKVLDALAGLRVREIGPDEIDRFDPDNVLLMNVNTPEDLARAVARAESSGA